MSDKIKLLLLPADGIGTDSVELLRRIELAVEKCQESSVLTADLGGDASSEQVCEKALASLLR